MHGKREGERGDLLSYPYLYQMIHSGPHDKNSLFNAKKEQALVGTHTHAHTHTHTHTHTVSHTHTHTRARAHTHTRQAFLLVKQRVCAQVVR